MLILCGLILIFGLLFILPIFFKLIRISRIVGKLPGPPRINLLFGNFYPVLYTAEEIFKYLKELSLEYYPIFKLYMSFIHTTCILHPDDFETILTNPKHNAKGNMYDAFTLWLNSGLLTSNGDKWHERRKILTPAFHFQILNQFISIFNEETSKLVEIFKKECHNPHIKITSHIYQFTLTTIAETAMGTKLDSKFAEAKNYRDAIKSMGELVVNRIVKPWLHPTYFYYYLTPSGIKERKVVRTLHNFTRNVISKRQRNFNHFNENSMTYSSRKRLAMLDLLLSCKLQEEKIDDEGIREEVDTFMFEGHDTTAVALCYCLMLIACHKDVQGKIVDELETIFGDFKHYKKPTYNDLQEMKYLERCIKESLRLYPSVHIISRVLGEDVMAQSGYLIPKDSVVNLLIYNLHRNPEIYPDPDKFDPDRFLLENSQNRHVFAYVPFSAGPRNCIGQKFAMLELKAAISGILRNFVLEPVDTPSTITLLADIIMKTKEDIKIKFVPRLNNNNFKNVV